MSVETDNKMELTVVGYYHDTAEEYVEHVIADSVGTAILLAPDGVIVVSVFFGHLIDLASRPVSVTLGGKTEQYRAAYQSSIRRVDGKLFEGSRYQVSPLFSTQELAESWADLQPQVVLVSVEKTVGWSTDVKDSL